MSIKFFVLGGGLFWVWGGGDFIFMGVGIFLRGAQLVTKKPLNVGPTCGNKTPILKTPNKLC